MLLSNPIASMLPAQYELKTMEAPKDYDIRTNVIGLSERITNILEIDPEVNVLVSIY